MVSISVALLLIRYLSVNEKGLWFFQEKMGREADVFDHRTKNGAEDNLVQNVYKTLFEGLL